MKAEPVVRAGAVRLAVLALLASLVVVGGGARPAAADEPPVFLTKWGSFGSSDSQLGWLSRIAVGPGGNVFVTSTNNTTQHRVHRFDPTGQFLNVWGSFGAGPGQFSDPGGIAVHPNGDLATVYVADTQNDRIQMFSPTGDYVGSWGRSGSGNGQFRDPEGVAVDISGNVYVADFGNDRIQKFTSTGTFVTQWGSEGSGNGRFNGPSDVAVDSNGNVYVADQWNHRIQRFTSSGSFVTTWGTRGAGRGQFDLPVGLGLDRAGSVYVADYLNDRVQKFTPTGSFLYQLGQSGTGNGQFREPIDVAVGPDGAVFVADDLNHRIQKFGSPSFQYFAMGDSYSSGEGVGYYQSGTNTSTNRCHRSARAFPTIFRLPGHGAPLATETPGTLRFVACSGAQTGNVDAIAQYNSQPAQLTSLVASTATDKLVTITIGGNNLDFAGILTFCAGRRSCPNAQLPGGGTLADAMPARLDSLENSLRVTLQGLRGQSRSVWLVGYPMLFPDTRAEQTCTKLAVFGPGEQNFFRRQQMAVNARMAAVAREVGIHWVDVSGWFANHEVCADLGEWISGPTLGTVANPVGLGSFHPNVTGQAQYANAVRVAMRNQVNAGCALEPTELPSNPPPGSTSTTCR